MIADVARLLDNIERDSLPSTTKHNSLLEWWHTKKKKRIKIKEADKEEKYLLIERDRIITINTKKIIIENEKKENRGYKNNIEY